MAGQMQEELQKQFKLMCFLSRFMDLCAHSVFVYVGGPARCACQRCLVTVHLTRQFRTVTGVARLHYLYLAGVSVVRCQIVIALVVSYSLCQSSRSRGCSRLVAVQYSLKGADWTLFSARAGDSALPGLLHLHCRCYLHLHCVLESAPALPFCFFFCVHIMYNLQSG